jgi:rRNA-processing protein FCF1
MDKYVIDADAFINLDHHYRDRFNTLRRLASNGRVFTPEGVLRELSRKSDKLSKRIEKWRDKYTQFIVQISQNQQLMNELARIERTYGERISVGEKEYNGFWSSSAGRKAADGQVVTVAKVLGCTIVSDDMAVKFACMLENVPCIGWTEFARKVEIPEKQQRLL